MKSIVKPIIVITAVFLVTAATLYMVITNHYKCEDGMRNVVMNRITSETEKNLAEAGSDDRELSLEMLPDMTTYKAMRMAFESLLYPYRDPEKMF